MNLQPLPFTSKFQSGLIYLTITDLDFFKSVIEDLEYKHFDASENHAKLYKLILKLAKTTGRTLTLQIIKNALTQLNKSNALSDGDFIGMTTILDSGSTLIPAEMEYIKLNVIEFLKKQSVALAYSKSLEYFERGDYDTMFDIMSKAHKKSFGIGNNLGLNYTQQALNDRYSQPPRLDVWSTGYPTLDKYLDGGFARKEAISLLSATGRGKTSLLSNLAVSSILSGKKTIFYTLELSELQIAQRVDAILSSFSIKELSNLGQARIEIQKRIKEIKENSLFIKEFDRGKLSITGLKNHLDKYCMDFGKPDVVIVDWIGCMKLNMSGDRKKHEAIAEIADDIVNLSREYVVTMLTSQQTNRTAVGNNLFGYDSISESFSSLFGMDIVLGLGASDKAKDAGRRTLQILKSRVGPDSVYVNLIGDKPDQPLTFKFREAPPEEEQIDLLKEST